MTDQHKHPEPARHARLVGALAIALAASLVIQNAIVIGVGGPAFGDPIAQVFDFHAQNRTAVAIVIGLEALNLPLLLGFVTGLQGIVERRGSAGVGWSRLAVAAAATLSAVFAIYAVLWAGVVLYAGLVAEPNATFELIWRLHAAAFALALPALGVTFVGAALAAHASGLTPPWLRMLGWGGAALLVAAGGVTVAIADGSPLLFVGMPGYAAWLVWLVAAGVRLMRTRRSAAT
ncbi:MAG: hypothetical protein IPM90_14525 [Austwickia sp.]|nr:hypothetical protein [Austwickia sp.]